MSSINPESSQNIIKIFISSPGDVSQERVISQHVIENLQGRFMGYARLEPVFWEHEPLMASSTFQDQIILPSETDIVVCILWSRLGTRLPENITRKDGSIYASGTEFEFEDALAGFKRKGSPALLVYQKTQNAVLSLVNEQDILNRLSQKKALDSFINKWFINQDGSIKSAFHSFDDPEQFEIRLEQHLQVLIERLIKQRGLTADDIQRHVNINTRCPYAGLAAFDSDDQQLFFGRTREIHEIIDALKHQAAADRSFLMLLGSSGSGKSSLLKAGVIPVLTRPGVVDHIVQWRHATIRLNTAQHPISALIDGLTQDSALPELTPFLHNESDMINYLIASPDMLNVQLKKMLADITEGAVEQNTANQSTDAGVKSANQANKSLLILYIDQFEELFTNDQIETKHRQQFIAVLDALARSGSVWIMTSLRSDFYSFCDQFPQLTKLKEGFGQYDLTPPQAAQIAQMIRQPALFSGLAFEEDKVTRVRLDEVLIDSASRNPNALPLLSFTLESLFNLRTDEGLMTFDSYRTLGGIEGALAKRAENTWNTLNQEEKNAFPTLLARLIQTSSSADSPATRRVFRWQANDINPHLQAIIKIFTQARLLVVDASTDDSSNVSIAHEALIEHWPRLSEWVADNRFSLVLQHKITQGCKEWASSKNDPSFLFTGTRLAEIESWFEKNRERLTRLEMRFVEQSISTRDDAIRAEEERKARELQQAHEAARKIRLRNKWISAVGVVSTLLAVLAGLLFFQSEQQRTLAVTARDQADELVGFMIRDLSLKLEEVGRLDILKDATEQAKMYFSQQSGDELSVEARISHLELLSEIGYIQHNQGQLSNAAQTYQTMLEQSKTLVAEEPDNKLAGLNLIVAHFYIGQIHWFNKDFPAALKSFQFQQTTTLAMLAAWPGDPDFQEQLSLSYANVAAVLEKQQAYDEAAEQIKKSIDLGRSLLQQTPDDPVKLSALADNYRWLGRIALRQDQNATAKDYFEQALNVFSILLERSPDNLDIRYDVAISHHWLLDLYLKAESWQRAETHFIKAISLLDALVEIEPGNVHWLSYLIEIQLKGIRLYQQSGQTNRVQQLSKKARSRLQQLIATDAKLPKIADLRQALDDLTQ